MSRSAIDLATYQAIKVLRVAYKQAFGQHGVMSGHSPAAKYMQHSISELRCKLRHAPSQYAYPNKYRDKFFDKVVQAVRTWHKGIEVGFTRDNEGAVCVELGKRKVRLFYIEPGFKLFECHARLDGGFIVTHKVLASSQAGKVYRLTMLVKSGTFDGDVKQIGKTGFELAKCYGYQTSLDKRVRVTKCDDIRMLHAAVVRDYTQQFMELADKELVGA